APGDRAGRGGERAGRRVDARGAVRRGPDVGGALRLRVPRLRQRRRLRPLLRCGPRPPVRERRLLRAGRRGGRRGRRGPAAPRLTPEDAMRLAPAQARRALGRTFPNPSAGAGVFRGERVLGRGATRPPGGAHAEVVAIEQAARRHGRRALRGASLAVTLEPCSHHGRTPPCTDALVAAGLARVYVGHRDPSPHAAGGGLRVLRRAGIAVEGGVLEAACREQHRGFLSVVERGRPWVTLKLAASLDGRIATAAGESRWISSAASRAYVHRLRARSDAIAIGASSALADDPALTARRGA